MSLAGKFNCLSVNVM